MAIVMKPRSTRVETTTVVAGYYENVVRDAKGRVIERTGWKPQTLKDKDENEIPITVNVPIEEQFNNGRGMDYYRNKGYLPLKEAEVILCRDFSHLKFQRSQAVAPSATVAAAPAITSEASGVLKPKTQKPRKPSKG